MNDLTSTVDTYLAAWNETDAAVRDRLVAQVWAADGRLVDPPAAGEGHAGISGIHAALQQQFPGHRFRRATAVDAHHDRARFGWELVGSSGDVALAGLDVALVAEDGRLREVTGFFGDLQPA